MSEDEKLAPPPLFEIGNRSDPGDSLEEGSESAGSDRETTALEDSERLRELRESFSRWRTLVVSR
ncbi:hypothetical protein GGQ11_003168 [Salinibacter ruber]|nr:hypothetical protein [Salinibacter ruber]